MMQHFFDHAYVERYRPQFVCKANSDRMGDNNFLCILYRLIHQFLHGMQLEVQLNLMSIQLRHLYRFFNQTVQAPTFFVDDGQQLTALVGCQLQIRPQTADGSHDRRKRRSQLVRDGIQQRAADPFAFARGFSLSQLLHGPGSFYCNRDHASQGFKTLPRGALAQDAERPDGANAHHERDHADSLFFNSLNIPLARGGAKRFIADCIAAASGMVDASSRIHQQGCSLGEERGGNNPWDRIQQIEDIIGRKQLAAEVIQALHFNSLAFGFFRFIPGTVGKPAG